METPGSADYKVHLTFSGKLSETHKNKIIENILNAIMNEIGGAGITPDESEEYTTIVTVSRGKQSLMKDVSTGEFI